MCKNRADLREELEQALYSQELRGPGSLKRARSPSARLTLGTLAWIPVLHGAEAWWILQPAAWQHAHPHVMGTLGFPEENSLFRESRSEPTSCQRFVSPISSKSTESSDFLPAKCCGWKRFKYVRQNVHCV